MDEETWLSEDDERIGKETDEWMDVKEATEYIDMSDSPGDIVVRFTGKPTMARSKFGGKKQFWFPVNQMIDTERGIWSERILSTGSTKLRRQIKNVLEKNSDLFDGKKSVGISWTGQNMDRSYSASVVVVGDPE